MDKTKFNNSQLTANLALFNAKMNTDFQSTNLASMGLDPTSLLNLINSHNNSPQDTTTHSSSENGEHSYFEGDQDNLDEKWQRNFVDDEYSNDEQLEKINNIDDEETLENDVLVEEENESSYIHDLRTHSTRTAGSDNQLIKALALEQLNVASNQNKENKLMQNIQDNSKEELDAEEDHMELDEQKETNDKVFNDSQSNLSQKKLKTENVDNGQSDLED